MGFMTPLTEMSAALRAFFKRAPGGMTSAPKRVEPRPRDRLTHTAPRTDATPSIGSRILAAIRSGGVVGAMVVAGIALSFASFFTTMEGLLAFTADVPVNSGTTYSVAGYILAILVSAGIQITAFGASWKLAMEVAARYSRKREASRQPVSFNAPRPPRPRPFVIEHAMLIMIFAVAFFCSVFFSFDSLFTRVFKDRELEMTQISVARSQTAGVMGELERLVREQQRTEALDMVDTPEWKAIENNMRQIIELGQSSRSEVDRYLTDQAGKVSGELRTLTSSLTQVSTKIAQLEAERAQLAQAGARPSASAAATAASGAGQRVADLTESVAKLQVELDKKLEEAAAEEKNGRIDPATGKRTPPGRGKFWKAIMAEADEIKTRLAQNKAVLKRETDELAKEQNAASAAEKASQTAATERSTRLAAIEAELPALQGQRGVMEARMKTLNVEQQALVGGDPSLDASRINATRSANLSRDLQTAITSFLQTGSEQHYVKLGATCNSLLEAMRNVPTLQGRVAGLSCDTQGVFAQVEALKARAAGFTQLVDKCKVDASYNALGTVRGYVNRGRECVSFAKLEGAQLINVIGALDRVERENSKETSHFTRTTASLMRGDSLAYIALILAIAIDGIVFLSALVGALAQRSPALQGGLVENIDAHKQLIRAANVDLTPHDHDRSDIVKYKAMLRHIRPAINAQNEYENIIDLMAIADETTRTNVRHLLMLISDIGTTRPARAGTSDVFIIDQLLVREYTDQIADYQEKRMASHGSLKTTAVKAPPQWSRSSPVGDTEYPAGSDGWERRSPTFSDLAVSKMTAMSAPAQPNNTAATTPSPHEEPARTSALKGGDPAQDPMEGYDAPPRRAPDFKVVNGLRAETPLSRTKSIGTPHF